MRINRIIFNNHPRFHNHEVIFDFAGTPTISFLVGNNGAGKTKILDAVFKALSSNTRSSHPYEVQLMISLSAAEMTAVGLTESELILTHSLTGDGGATFQVKDTHGNDHWSKVHNNFFKVIFSTVEVNFQSSTIETVTSKEVDEETFPKSMSENLSTEIPQLLVDISTLDAVDKGAWHDEHSGTTQLVPDNIGTRMKRFKEAFHKVYAGSKTFFTIENKNNKKRILFKDASGNEVGLNDLSTGEKQIIYRVGYILKNISHLKGAIVLIDEPEISLHPVWQISLKELLHELFAPYDAQIIIATHSPYIFQNLDPSKEQCIKIDPNAPQSTKVELVFPGVPFTPTVNLITYVAYGIPTDLLHIELYTLLQIREGRGKITGVNGIETWLRDPAGGAMPVRQSFHRHGIPHLIEESLMTWIRNRMHHSDEAARPPYTSAELKESIDEMIRLLQNP